MTRKASHRPLGDQAGSIAVPGIGSVWIAPVRSIMVTRPLTTEATSPKPLRVVRAVRGLRSTVNPLVKAAPADRVGVRANDLDATSAFGVEGELKRRVVTAAMLMRVVICRLTYPG